MARDIRSLGKWKNRGGGSIQGRMKTLILKIIWMRKMRMRKTQTTTPRYWKIMLKESLVVRGEEAALNLVLNKMKTCSHKAGKNL